MAVFVKSHRRGKSVVRAYTRVSQALANSKVGTLKRKLAAKHSVRLGGLLNQKITNGVYNSPLKRPFRKGRQYSQIERRLQKRLHNTSISR